MKAKVINKNLKEYGQIIDVFNVQDDLYIELGSHQFYTEKRESSDVSEYAYHYDDSELDFNDIIDWEERRFELVKSMMSNSKLASVSTRSDLIKIADAMISELKNQI